MTDPVAKSRPSPFEALRRYVPLTIWAVVLLVVLIIPLKIISDGYLPVDDALRHAAKAVNGRSWTDILVLSPAYRMDPNLGWHWLLRQFYLLSHCDTEALVILSVVGLFVVNGWAAMACLKRPEAWLAAMIFISMIADQMVRFLIGRPFMITITALMVILLMWQRHPASSPRWRVVWWMTPLIAAAVFLHGVWYLWALPVAAFFLAGQFRWTLLLVVSWLAGTLLGAALTGHPVTYIVQALEWVMAAFGKHQSQKTLVTEFTPLGADIYPVIILGGLIVLRQLARLNTVPLVRNPIFWLAALGWLLGCETRRFWGDWGCPALMILVVCDLQVFFEGRFIFDSFQRLGLVCALALTAIVVVTNDANGRWTHSLDRPFLTADNPDLKGWLPEPGGIFYTADMSLFFDTIFKNPEAKWRYVLGFEPAMMTDENLKVYQSILETGGDPRAYEAWVEKMKPADRLAVRGGSGTPPTLPELEWNYGVTGIWIGRLPRTNAPPPAPTIPATATRQNVPNAATNSTR